MQSSGLCCNCVKPLGAVHIECAECQELLLCTECFAYGAELGDHTSAHSYRVRNTGGLPVFHDENSSTFWSCAEEIRLLNAVERFNLGNWHDVQQLVSTTRSTKEIRDHYDRYYLHGKIGQVTLRGLSYGPVEDHTEKNGKADKDDAQNAVTVTCSPPVKDNTCKINPDDLRMLAYMPHRDDFEMEYRNDAETVISNVLVFIDDDDLDRELKLTLIDIYIRNLIERRRRKALSRDYNLVYNFFKEEKPQGGSTVYQYPPSVIRVLKKEKDLRTTLKKFAQFLPCSEFHELVSNIITERTLKQRIRELQEYSRNGIKSLKGTKKFDLSTPLRRKRKITRIRFTNGARRNLNRWHRMRRWHKKLSECNF